MAWVMKLTRPTVVRLRPEREIALEQPEMLTSPLQTLVEQLWRAVEQQVEQERREAERRAIMRARFYLD